MAPRPAPSSARCARCLPPNGAGIALDAPSWKPDLHNAQDYPLPGCWGGPDRLIPQKPPSPRFRIQRPLLAKRNRELQKLAEVKLTEAALAAPNERREAFESAFAKASRRDGFAGKGGDELELPKELREIWRRLMGATVLVEAWTKRDLHQLRTTAQTNRSTRAALQAVTTLVGVPDASGQPVHGMRTILGDLGSLLAKFQPQKITQAQFTRLH